MKKLMKSIAALMSVAALTMSAIAQDSGALVDALVKKGVLSDQEAEEIRADLTKEFGQTSAGKLNLASHVTQLKLYGDARVRYTTEQDYLRSGANGGANREQLRYRLRIGGEYAMTDSFKAGVQLATGGANDSANATFGEAGTATDGAFGRTAENDEMTVDLVFLEYSPSLLTDLTTTVVAGRHKKTFELDWINWDGDINPEGFGQKVAYKIDDHFNIGWNGGQYLYEDATNASTSTTRHDTWMMVNQLVLGYKYNKDLQFQVAPMFHTMVNQVGDPVNEVAGASQDVSGNQNIMFVPVEAKWKSWGIPTKALYTYGHNFDAKNKLLSNDDTYDVSIRGNEQADTSLADQNDSHTFGLEVGELKKKKDWMVAAYYMHREAFSSNLDLVDSDWSLQRSNMKGYAFKSGYMFTDGVGLNVTYLIGDTLKDQIYPGTFTGDGQIADRSRVEVLQVDLTWKF